MKRHEGAGAARPACMRPWGSRCGWRSSTSSSWVTSSPGELVGAVRHGHESAGLPPGLAGSGGHRPAGSIRRGRRRRVRQLRLDDPLVAGLMTRGTSVASRVPPIGLGVRRRSARSQLAAAAWRRVEPDTGLAWTGARPADRVHPRAVRVGPPARARPGQRLDPRLADVHARRGRDGDAPLLVAVCDIAHEHLVIERPADGRVSTGCTGMCPTLFPADTDDAFEAAYGEIAQRVERLSSGIAMDRAVLNQPDHPSLLPLRRSS